MSEPTEPKKMKQDPEPDDNNGGGEGNDDSEQEDAEIPEPEDNSGGGGEEVEDAENPEPDDDNGGGGGNDDSDQEPGQQVEQVNNDDSTNNNHVEASRPQKASSGGRQISVRDRLLLKEVHELQTTLPTQCSLDWQDPDILSDFMLTIKPDEGIWKNGSFQFHVTVPEEYNMSPPRVKCITKIWHPNISEDAGAVCLSILRQSSIDEQGWAPTRGLKDVVWGVNSLFTDLLNFDDPLNGEAAKEHKDNPDKFRKTVRKYIDNHCRANHRAPAAHPPAAVPAYLYDEDDDEVDDFDE